MLKRLDWQAEKILFAGLHTEMLQVEEKTLLLTMRKLLCIAILLLGLIGAAIALPQHNPMEVKVLGIAMFVLALWLDREYL